MQTPSAFINGLLVAVPQLRETYLEHLKDNDGLLPHVFMGAVTRYAVDCAQDKSREGELYKLVQYVDRGLAEGSPEVGEMLKASFAENLVGEDSALEVIRALAGVTLNEAIDLSIRGGT